MILVFEVMYRGPTVPAAIRSLPARTPGVQISGFASLIVTCCSIFANAEKKKSVSDPQEISLLQSFFVLPEIKEIVRFQANTGWRVQVVTDWTLHTRQSKQGISQPVQNMQNTQ